MTPKEKAIELVDKYYWTFGDGYLGQQHIQCALIAVEEILNAIEGIFETFEERKYWQEVKQEIQKL
jgi:hypothetical protein